uniref:Uncharacterized protein n=1 Tax=Chromera velia CCMP2878 TaxID=1169474 RepID=A0A0G4HTR7_9ALVE|eukprot:Cvel_8482.t1-p1 / transcript=Cvel_8482.t1 / gene=Cvel_8482 / organism=Chromera_velia_CCMP2878 / gene_product=Tip elongation aberrant protein 1, putative / transcript_product=Tip elongation aberrant protein 1, putative / location=Cvel_scaffold468:69891-79291(-) / protein_length=498 / sequence_SO=supercontig / SO=protein_coding / is_pseudo=false
MLTAGPDDGSDKRLPVQGRSWEWERPQVKGRGPRAQGCYTATLVESKIFVFGGLSYIDGLFSHFNDVHILDVDSHSWLQPHCRGTPPEPRQGHTGSLVGKCIVYFAGRGEGGKHFKDLYALDTSTLTWHPLQSSGEAPEARKGHTCVRSGDSLYFFGGKNRTHFFGDLFALDMDSMAWSVPKTVSSVPSPRAHHAAVMVDHDMVVHGGEYVEDTGSIYGCSAPGVVALKKGEACYLNDTWVLDIPHLLWSRAHTTGTPPSGRLGHTVVRSDNDLIVFGGAKGLKKTTGVKDRQGELSDRAAPEGYQTGDELMSLGIEDMTWIQCGYEGVPPSNRCDHSVCVIGPHLVIVGGWDGRKPETEVLVLRDRRDSSRSDFSKARSLSSLLESTGGSELGPVSLRKAARNSPDARDVPAESEPLEFEEILVLSESAPPEEEDFAKELRENRRDHPLVKVKVPVVEGRGEDEEGRGSGPRIEEVGRSQHSGGGLLRLSDVLKSRS